jgi:hypothetical protein
MKLPLEPNFQEECETKEKAALLLRGLQHEEYFAEQDIIRLNLKIQRELARYITASDNNNNSNDKYSTEDNSDFYRHDKKIATLYEVVEALHRIIMDFFTVPPKFVRSWPCNGTSCIRS